jgi:hypothetical protein
MRSLWLCSALLLIGCAPAPERSPLLERLKADGATEAVAILERGSKTARHLSAAQEALDTWFASKEMGYAVAIRDGYCPAKGQEPNFWALSPEGQICAAAQGRIVLTQP